MDIAKILTLSTAHVTSETCNEYLPFGNPLTAYPKGEYGWFIFAGEPDAYHHERKVEGDVPADLMAALDLARQQGCDWLCLDRDGDETEELPTFDW
jgi:hypothetical protein